MVAENSFVILFVHLLLLKSISSQIPVVLWHGMGDVSRGPISLGPIIEMIEKQVPGIYIKSIRIGKNDFEDIFNSFFKDSSSQISIVCRELSADPKLKNGFNAVGFSQGSQFLRALVQRCSSLKVKNLISMAGQHQGVFGLPKCTPEWSYFCEYIRKILSKSAYESHFQDHVVQAQYWHDPLREDVYKLKSRFLANINQEQGFNSTYRENMIRLTNFVMAMANNDSVVIPRESEWFGYYKPGQEKDLYKLEESDLYVKDLLGLKVLKESGRLKFLSYDGDHLHFKKEWFVENIVEKFLK